jgi:hypothetical protein
MPLASRRDFTPEPGQNVFAKILDALRRFLSEHRTNRAARARAALFLRARRLDEEARRLELAAEATRDAARDVRRRAKNLAASILRGDHR